MKKFFSMLLCGVMLASFNACNTNEPDESDNDSNNNGGTGQVDPDNPNNNGSGNVVLIGPKEAVDLGLPSGTLWATCNVGATSIEDYGVHFAWGETQPKDNYTWDTYKYGTYDRENRDDFSKLTKYNLIDGLTILEPSDDAATVNWGAGWRMPTEIEQEELLTECTWQGTNNYNNTGVSGCIVTGKNGNSIFLPAAGAYHGTELRRKGSLGAYMSASRCNPHSIWGFFFYSDENRGLPDTGDRCDGYSVRPVRSPK